MTKPNANGLALGNNTTIYAADVAETDNKMNSFEYVKKLCEKARAAQHALASVISAEKNAVLLDIARSLVSHADEIIAENEKDIALAEQNGVIPTMIDRLRLDKKRIESIADAIKEVARLADPIGEGSVSVRPNGLKIMKTRVPLGTIGIIYEARPNVTADAAALCLKSGNAVILKGGKEAINTNRKIVDIMRVALYDSDIPCDVIQLIDDVSRESTNALMKMRGLIDVLIPRGGKGLIKAVVENADVPVIETGAGNCHIYIDRDADLQKSVLVSMNAKASRPSVCNAVETMLVHESVAKEFLPMFAERAALKSIELRGCEKTKAILPDVTLATESDYETEFNDYILAVKVVSNIDEAIEHIREYSTGHSEAIMTENYSTARLFCQAIDAAAVYVNASTRFTDGGEFGLGAEIGISTQKLHTRGPMGLSDLTTVKYIVEGTGQTR